MTQVTVQTEQWTDNDIERTAADVEVKGASDPPAPLKLIAGQLGVATSALVAFVREQGILPATRTQNGMPLFDAAILSAAVEANRAWFEERVARVQRDEAAQRASAEAKRKRVEADALRRLAEREAPPKRRPTKVPAALQPLPTTTIRAGGRCIEVFVRRAPGKEQPLGAASGCAHAAHTPVENATTQRRSIAMTEREIVKDGPADLLDARGAQCRVQR